MTVKNPLPTPSCPAQPSDILNVVHSPAQRVFSFSWLSFKQVPAGDNTFYVRSFLSFVLTGPFSTLKYGITVAPRGHLGYSVFVHFLGGLGQTSHVFQTCSRVLPSVPSHIAVVLSEPHILSTCTRQGSHPHTGYGTPLSLLPCQRYSAPIIQAPSTALNSGFRPLSSAGLGSAFGPRPCTAVTELCSNQELGRWWAHPQSSHS